MRRIVIFGDRVICFVLVLPRNLVSESTTLADRRRTPVTFVCDSGPAGEKNHEDPVVTAFWIKRFFRVLKLIILTAWIGLYLPGGGNAPRPGFPIMLYTINRNYSITSWSFALRMITKRSRKHDNSIQSAEGRRRRPGKRLIKICESCFCKSPSQHRLLSRNYIYCHRPRHTYEKYCAYKHKLSRGPETLTGKWEKGVNEWWIVFAFFLIYSARNTRNLFFPRRFRIPPTPAVLQVDSWRFENTVRMHGTIILLSIFGTRLIFDRKKKATNSSNAFTKNINIRTYCFFQIKNFSIFSESLFLM